MPYPKKGYMVAMTTPLVRQLVNNSSPACSSLIFVFLQLRLYKHDLKFSYGFSEFPEEVRASPGLRLLFLFLPSRLFSALTMESR